MLNIFEEFINAGSSRVSFGDVLIIAIYKAVNCLRRFNWLGPTCESLEN